MIRHFVGTLYGKIALVICLVFILSVTVIGIHQYTLVENGIQQEKSGIEREMEVRAASLNTSFHLLEENLFYLSETSTWLKELSRYTTEEELNSLSYWACVTGIRGQLSTLQNSFPYVENIFLYSPSRNLFLNDQVNPEMAFRVRQLFTESTRQGFPDFWQQISLSGNFYLLRVFKTRNDCLGIWVSCDELRDSFLSGAEESVLASPDGTVLSPRSAGVTGPLDLNGENPSLVTGYAEHPGLCLARPVRSGTAGVWATSPSMLLVSLLHLLLLATVLLALHFYVLRPLHRLTDGIQRIRQGDTDYRLAGEKHSLEFRNIVQEFNSMMDETRRMRISMYEQKLQQDKVRLRYLSAQIQPHFILNSLNMLYAYIGRDDEVSRNIIRLLTRYYRFIVNIDSQYVQLGQEVDHLENYLAFQKIRYGGRLDYTVSCPREARDVSIPPLLLESFVGNALKHGQDAEDLIRIEITVSRPEAQTTRILIRDHGSGFPEEMLDAFEVYAKTGKKDELLGVGIRNSMDRLRLIYQDNASLFFYNAADGGAIVEIRIRSKEGM